MAIANAYAKILAAGFDESETFTGWTIGAGIEHAFTDNLIGSLEYRCAYYGSKDIGELVNVDLD